MQGMQVFQSGKKKLKTSVQLCFLLPARKQDKPTIGDSHFFKHFSCRFFLSPPVSVYYVIIPIKQYISVQGYKEILLFIYRTSSSTIDVKRAYLDLYSA